MIPETAITKENNMIPETAITIGKFIVIEYDDGYEEIVPVLSVPYTVSAKEALELLKVYGVDDLYPGTARFEVFSTAFDEGQIVWMEQVRREATKEEEEECAIGIQQRYGCDIYKIIRAYKKEYKRRRITACIEAVAQDLNASLDKRLTEYFPEATSGDELPEDALGRHMTIEHTVRNWVKLNVTK